MPTDAPGSAAPLGTTSQVERSKRALQPLDQGGAIRDGALDAELDQALGDGKRDQTLRALARDLELGRDLVLRRAVDVVEPGRPGGEVEPAGVHVGGVGHGAASAR